MTKVCLIFVFNFRYDQNLEKLRRVYERAFSHIRSLVPFYDGTATDAIAISESSYCFQGYFAQAFHQFYAPSFTHYAFVADDLVLNPKLNEKNLISSLGLDTSTSFIKGIHPITDGHDWFHIVPSLRAFAETPYIDSNNLLPSREEAGRLLARHGIVNTELSKITAQKLLGHSAPRRWVDRLWASLGLLDRTVPYPCAFGYSDFIVVPAAYIRQFCRLCGIFAAMNLFAEVAVPTALAFASERINTERDLDMKGVEVWDKQQVEAFGEEHGYEIHTLLSRFPKDRLYIHPVKLSKWHLTVVDQ
jgi:hypothetical protein